ncbi:MAG: OmpA family protein [Sphingopyxis sp.]
MNGVTKFIIGGVATCVMAMAAHGALGTNAAFVDRLEGEARTALGNAGGTGLAVHFEREPALRRVAIITGTADAATRATILAAVRAVPGVADARWADDGAASNGATGAASTGAATAAAPAATPAAVASCQTQVDAAIGGNIIQFDRGHATISAQSNGLIAAIAAALGPCAGVSVEVSGHTDASGSPATNAALSQARAQAVVTALTARGVPAERLTAHGYGSTKPKVAGRGAAADAANRRIEFTVASTATAAATAPAPATDQGN